MSAHGMTATIVSREPNVWRVRCNCRKGWQEPTYEAAEDQWRQHVYIEADLLVRPAGDKTVPRWEP